MTQRKCRLITVNYGMGAEDPGCGDGPAAVINSASYQRLVKSSSRELPDIHPITSCSRASKFEALSEVVRINTLLAHQTCQAVRDKEFFIVLGGDHSCGIGTWSGVANACARRFSLIWIDAHLDSHTMTTTPSKNLHGMPVAVLLGQGHPDLTGIGTRGASLLAEDIIIAGARSYEPAELALLDDLGVHIIFMEDIQERGIGEALNRAVQLARSRQQNFGISIDMDAFEPGEIPGVGTAVSNGIAFGEFYRAYHTLVQAAPDLLGIEICEYNPSMDDQNKTLEAIIRLLAPVLNTSAGDSRNESISETDSPLIFKESEV